MIAVTTINGQHLKIDATTWHVDDSHALHLRSTSKAPVASFAAGQWAAVVRLPDDGQAPAPDA